jgi:hypothetical protein
MSVCTERPAPTNTVGQLTEIFSYQATSFNRYIYIHSHTHSSSPAAVIFNQGRNINSFNKNAENISSLNHGREIPLYDGRVGLNFTKLDNITNR